MIQVAVSNTPFVAAALDEHFDRGRAANDDLARAVALNPRTFLIETPFGGHIGQPGTMPGWFASVVTTFFRRSAGI